MKSVFVSGSISIKKIPEKVITSLQTIIEKQLHVYVGDAPGIDSLVQDFCSENGYSNVTVYSITAMPRYKALEAFKSKHVFVEQEIKKERERQRVKDKAMSDDSEFSLVVWDGKSQGSYSNIIRALEQDKKVKVYYSGSEDFLPPEKVERNEIDFIFREHNGYTASEVVDYLQGIGIETYKRSQDINKFLLEQKILIKDDKVYIPTDKRPELFIVEKYRGRPSGVKFNNQFIDWIEAEEQARSHQGSLF